MLKKQQNSAISILLVDFRIQNNKSPDIGDISFDLPLTLPAPLREVVNEKKRHAGEGKDARIELDLFLG